MKLIRFVLLPFAIALCVSQSHAQWVHTNGPPGVGKTHLAMALGIKATQARNSVFFTAEQVTQVLANAELSGRHNKTLENLTRVELLIIDELGYLSLTK